MKVLHKYYTFPELINDKTIEDIKYVRSGVSFIDEHDAGYPIGELSIIGGATGTGKSFIMLLSALRCCAIEELNVGFFSLETHISEDKKRMENIALHYGYDEKKLKNFFYYPHIDTALKIDELENDIKQQKLDIVFIDSIDFIEGSMGATGMDVYNNYSANCQKLISIAAKHDIPVVVSIQLQPEALDKTIEQLHVFMLSGGKATSYKTAVIWGFLKKDSNHIYLKCLKDRNSKHVVGDYRVLRISSGDHILEVADDITES